MKTHLTLWQAFAILTASSFLFSCASIDFAKRKYMPGYYAQVMANNNVQKQIPEIKDETEIPKHTYNTQKNSIINKNTYKIDDMAVETAFAKAEINSEPGTMEQTATSDFITRKKLNSFEPEQKFRFSMKQLKQLKRQEEIIAQSNREYVWTSNGDDGDNKNLAIVGLVLGIVGCVGYYGSFCISPAAIVVSIIAMSKIKKDPREFGGKQMAVWGLILGIVGVIAWAAVIFLIIGSAFI